MNVEVSLHIQNWKARFIEAGFFVVHQPTPPSTFAIRLFNILH